NARAETVASKPSFREAFRYRRCLVPADGFYEWKKEGGRKPVYIRRKDGQPFAFAGLWEEWEREGEIIESCVIITTQANQMMAEYHDRMPVILHSNDYDLWLAAARIKQVLELPELKDDDRGFSVVGLLVEGSRVYASDNRFFVRVARATYHQIEGGKAREQK